MRYLIPMVAWCALSVGAVQAAKPAARKAATEQPREAQQKMPRSTYYHKMQVKALREMMDAYRMGAPLNACSANGYTVLMQAAAAGNERCFMDLLLAGADVHYVTPDGVNLLMLAAAGRNEQIFMRVLRAMPEAAAKTDVLGNTLLHYACLGGNEQIVQMALKVGGNAHEANRMGYTPLINAARSGNVQLFYGLLSRGADAEPNTKDGYNILIAAAESGELQMVQAAYHLEVDPVMADANGNTALMAAAVSNSAAVAAFLMRKGCDKSLRNVKGVNAAMFAAAAGNASLCLELGGKADMAPDNAGRSLLEYAAEGGSITLLRRLMKEKEPSVEALRKAMKAAVQARCTTSALELARRVPGVTREELLALPVDSMDAAISYLSYMAEFGVGAKDRAMAEVLYKQLTRAAKSGEALSTPSGAESQHTPIQNAIDGGYYNLVHFLIAEGAHVNALDGYGKSALLSAVEDGNYTAAKMLLRSGADPNAMDRSGYTPLMVAAGRADLALFNLLTEHGADPDEKRNGGPTVMGEAERAGEPAAEIMNRLQGKPTRPATREEAFRVLCAAINQNKPDVFRTVLADWPEPNAADEHGTTLLMHAAGSGCDLSILRLLLNRGADVNAVNHAGLTPLFYASGNEKRELLRKHGAKENF